ncbi:hypothetical protein [Pantoea stewartii]|nr:hypothetical protein [Pantoea stewartii]MCU7369265.1 hypothetical protein [Pantoea stewartii]
MQNNINTQKSEKDEAPKNATFSVSVKKKTTNDQRRALGALVK